MKYDSITIDGVEYRPYDHLYSVSACGKVLRKNEPYTPTIHPQGYAACGGNRLVHRLVATVWLRPPEKGEHCHHKNHDKLDNRVDNLEWITPRKHLTERHADVIQRFTRTGPTEAGKQRLRELRLGQKHSEETRAKIGASLKAINHRPAPRYGKRSAEEMARRAKNPTRSTPCIVDGVRYISFAEAGRALGVRSLTLRKRCLSENFPNYQLE